MNIHTIFLGFILLFEANAGIMDINNFFPDIKGNLTKITWAHAVNNKEYLLSALNDSTIMMLEADVVYGKVNGTGELIPIMGHPPAEVSDLSLEEFLITTYNFNMDSLNNSSRKGVKLDFKSTEVFTKSIPYINKLYDMIDYPIWINADIISGPFLPLTAPVDPSIFLPDSSVFTKSVLSLGWTTTIPLAGLQYTDEQINKMTDAIQKYNVTQNITFAVRAGIAAESLEQMMMLNSAVANCTLTIWSSAVDAVNVAKLRAVIREYGIKRVYIDVPGDLYNKLDLGNL